MTLDQWLQEATGTSPPGVRERLAQEYTAHLEDSVAAGGSVDALELFGEPKQVERKLQKIYYTQRQFTAVSGQKSWGFWFMFVIIVLALLFNILISLSDGFKLPVSMIVILLYSTALIIMGLIWVYSKNWMEEIKVKFRNQYGVTTAAFFNTSNQLISNDSSLRWFIVAILAMFVVTVPFMLSEDRRLRRTLEVERASLKRQRVNLPPERW